MTTYVHYLYRAPGSSEDVEIGGETWPDKTPQDVLPLIEAVGSITKVLPYDSQERGKGLKEYKVLEYQQATAPWGDDLQTVPNMLLVVVTDPDA